MNAVPKVVADALPASRKIHLQGTRHPDVRVPMRCIAPLRSARQAAFALAAHAVDRRAVAYYRQRRDWGRPGKGLRGRWRLQARRGDPSNLIQFMLA